MSMTDFENHGGPCKTRCERPACMCAHEKLARECADLKRRLALADAVVEATKRLLENNGGRCDAHNFEDFEDAAKALAAYHAKGEGRE